MNMNAMMKECSKPHNLAHLVTGAGIGVLVLALLPAFLDFALILGLVLLVGGLAWDMMVNPAKKSAS